MVRLGYCALLAGLVAALLLAGRSGAAPSGQSDRVDMRFEIYGFGGLHLVSNRTTVDTTPGRYAIAMDLSTRGLASVFVDLESHSEVRGRVIGDIVRPEAYIGDVRRNGAERHNRVEYAPDGSVLSAISGPSPTRPTLVAADRTRGTVDQLTAYFMLERGLAHGSGCDRVIPVYDGRLRYNLRFAAGEPEPLPDDPDHQFTGPTRVCEMSREEVAGFTSSDDHNDGAYRGKIWYSLLPGGELMVPVRMTFDTELGLVRGYLAELHGHGANVTSKY